MRNATLAVVSAALLAGCTLYFDSGHDHGGGGGLGPGGGSIASYDAGIPDPPPDQDGGVAGGDDGGFGCGGPAQPALAAEQQWAACLTVSLNEFTQTGANTISVAQTSSGRCDACHGAGGAGEYFNADAAATLDAWATQAFVEAAFAPTASYDPSGNVVYHMAVAQQKLCSTGTQLAGNEGTHPSFDCNATYNGVAAMDALEQFRALVQAKLEAGQCPPPGFSPPIDPTTN